jgi:acyl-CoA synthetase (AMP-forming)/AMP-acid ligase II
MDEDGHLYFIARIVDTIKHKGYRISASEIEEVLQAHQALVDSCVVDVPDPKAGDKIRAFVVLQAKHMGISRADFLLLFFVFNALTVPCYEYTVHQKTKHKMEVENVGCFKM